MRIPSPSGAEARAARLLADWGIARGLSTLLDDAGVRLEVASGAPGPTLLLVSHLDTVPPGEGWARDPFGGDVEDGLLHGRGAVDAKASVAAMAVAADRLAASGGPARGRLVVLASYGEESRSATLPEALRRLGPIDLAVVGEPTSLGPCTAQRGLLVVRLTWRGTPCHAAWAATLAQRPVNPIEVAAVDLAGLARLGLDRTHPTLGLVAVTPTRIEAGDAHNAIPATCHAVLDVRTTPAYETAEIVDAIRRAVRAEVQVVSDRYPPCETVRGSAVLAAVQRARPGAHPVASPTASDWVFLRDVDTVKLGPGDSRLSHAAAEHVLLQEVDEAAALYAALATDLLAARGAVRPQGAAPERVG